MGAEDLIANGKDVIVIEYHINDPFETANALARQNYYYVTALPTVYFDGDIEYVGGNNTTSMYETYLPLYEQRKNILSSFSMDMSGMNSLMTDFVVDISIEKVAVNNSSNLALIVALTETDIPFIWMGQENVNYCERLMLPDANGTSLDFSTSSSLDFSFSFSLDPDWEVENCQLVAWIQDLGTKEIHQGIKRNLTDLGEFPLEDAYLKRVYSPLTVCENYMEPLTEIVNLGSENLTSLDINYQINNESLQTYVWTGNLDHSATEVIELPGVSFDILTSNDLQVYLSNPNGVQDEFPNNDSVVNVIDMAENVGSPVTLVLKLDNSPEETSWEILASDGSVLYAGGDYTDPGVFVTEAFDLSNPDCYTFRIYDSGGDGLTETGLFKLMYGSTIFSTGKDFGLQGEVQFGIEIVGIQDVWEPELMVYPNPAKDKINIQSEERINYIEIYTMDGRFVECVQVSGMNCSIDVSQFQAGNYILHIISESAKFHQLIVVQP